MKIGELYKEGITSYEEQFELNLTNNCFNLELYYSNITDKEIVNFSSLNQVQHTYICIDDVIYLFFKFGKSSWIECPFDIHLNKEKSLDEINKNNQHFILNVRLIDTDSGILKHARTVQLCSEFSKKLYDEIIEQKKKVFISSNYANTLNSVYLEYSIKDLVEKAEKLYISI